jgi:predicted metal-dependent hydrolase
MAAQGETPPSRQMSLFEWIGAVLPSAGDAGRLPSPKPAQPPRLPPAAVPPVAVPPVATSPQSPPLHVSHPRAGHQIVLGECRVGYLLKRAQRKSIGFVIGPDGLAVTAPRWLGQPDIDAALRAKSSWILRKLAEQRDRKRRVESNRVEWRDGGALPFLGTTLEIQLDARISGVQLVREAQGAASPKLRVGLPASAQPEQIRDGVQAWLQRQALSHFEARCAHFAPLLGVRVKRLRLSSAQTRWGSASADGSVRLHWRLIHFSPAVIDYVVAHELAHLREMNHSPAFWAVVESVIPDMAARKAMLRSPVVSLVD